MRFALTQPVRLHQSALGDHAVVDLAPQNFAGAMPDLRASRPSPRAKPVDVATLPEIKLRAGAYANFTRLVFDWPHDVPYTVFPGAGKMTVRFQAPAQARSVGHRPLQPALGEERRLASWTAAATVVEFETDTDSGYHDFKDGTKVVLDILAPKTDAAAYAPPGTDKPQATAIEQRAHQRRQAKAIADTARQLRTANRTPNPPEAKLPKPDTKAAARNAPQNRRSQADAKRRCKARRCAPPACAAPTHRQTCSSPTAAVTKTGAIVHFQGRRHAQPNAVFIRGLTAWMVLENTPGFDAATLENPVGRFRRAGSKRLPAPAFPSCASP